MNDRLEFATQREAQDCADAIHAKLQVADPEYAKSVQRGHTTAWAIPYLDDKTATWCVNVKDRGSVAVEPVDRARLKPILKPVLEVTEIGVK